MAGPMYLTHRRVYVLPTGRGLSFGCALLFMLAASINYSLSLGYMLTFLLTGTSIVAMLHTYRNLVHLRVSQGHTEAAFEGDTAAFELHFDNPGHYARIAIEIHSSEESLSCDVPARGAAAVSIRLRGARRGWLSLPRVRLESRFPLGLVRAWSYVHFDMRALIYPKPDQTSLSDVRTASGAGTLSAAGSGSDDFFGLRPYQPSDSLRHVAWKSVARNELLLTKLFNAQAAAELVFDFDTLPPAMDIEARVSRLTRWVLLAEENGMSYALHVPGTRIACGMGEAHRHECLKTLALLGLPGN